MITAEELLRMPDNGMFQELIDGEVFEMPPPGHVHGRVATNAAARIHGVFA
ncbi:MAG: Uma2 family endonuclease [Panacagrimonas sp.]